MTQLFKVFAHRTSGLNSKHAMPNFDRSPPVFVNENFPPSDHDVLDQLRTSTIMLNYYVRAFEAAMQLYEFVAPVIGKARGDLEKNPADEEADSVLEIFDGWPALAGRDGAITLFNIDKTMNGLIEGVERLPTLVAAGCLEKVRAAKYLLQTTFPDIPKIRHAVAHSAERLDSQPKMAEHSYYGPWHNSQMDVVEGAASVSTILVDTVNQRSYSNTWEGNIVSYRMEEASVKVLADVRNMVFDALTL